MRVKSISSRLSLFTTAQYILQHLGELLINLFVLKSNYQKSNRFKIALARQIIFNNIIMFVRDSVQFNNQLTFGTTKVCNVMRNSVLPPKLKATQLSIPQVLP